MTPFLLEIEPKSTALFVLILRFLSPTFASLEDVFLTYFFSNTACDRVLQPNLFMRQ